MRNSQKIVQKMREWKKKNKQRHRLRERARTNYRLKTEPEFRLLRNLRRRLLHALDGNRKAASTIVLIGCTPEQLKRHLESQFLPHMHWNNQGVGRGKWHIDHIIPCAAFDLSREDQQRLCFHFTNLRPLWSVQNQRKSGKFVGTMPLL